MKKFIAIGALLGAASAYHPINQDIIDEIKQKATTWKPMEADKNPLSKLSYQEIKGLLGTIPHDDLYSGDFAEPQILGATPTNFDGRTQWGNCVHPIRDQKACGSCWAFAATEALSDRFCIASKGAVDVILSPEDLVECDSKNFGCDGGYLSLAWSYLYNTGAVSEDCLPYSSGLGIVKACPTSCTGAGEEWTKYKCASKAVKSTTVAGIKSDIYANGPVETGFTVYADFMNYSGGIYKHVTGKQEGGHAVKIIGWGVDTSTGTNINYWICANSWNTDWGEQGFFRIQEGECGINDATYGCAPDLNVKQSFIQ